MLSLDGSNGFKLNGVTALDQSGVTVASAGDVNGDGFSDLIIGADRVNGNSGASYVVFGHASGFAANFELSSLDGSNGFKLSGSGGELSGTIVASAGDVNGDGFADMLISAHSGEASYIVFGHADGFAANIDLSSLDGSNGFRLDVSAFGGFFGRSPGPAGDVNGDGFDDVIIGASNADTTAVDSGAAYVVFGHSGGFVANLDVASLDGTNGFRLDGVAAGDLAGLSAEGAGDINGDGFDDLIIGAVHADAHGVDSGASYVVFGHATGFAASIDLSNLDGINGFMLSGEAAGDFSGCWVSSAGDINGDGFDDLIIGARYADPNGTDSGASYVVFGGAFGSSSSPVTTTGTAANEILIGGLGNDTLTGGGGADVFRGGAGNDRLIVGDFSFARIDGGNGVDSFVFAGAGQTLDLTAIQSARMESIERFDLTGSGNNALIVGADDVLNFSGGGDNGFSAATSNKTFVIDGNAGDAVTLGPGVLPAGAWAQVGDNLGLDGSAAGQYDIFNFVKDGVVLATVAVEIDLTLTIL